MLLELGHIPIEEIAWGRKTLIEGKVLQISREELLEKTKGDDYRIAAVRADLASPTRVVRIIPVKDVVEPRVKVEGKGGEFPGLISGVEDRGNRADPATTGGAPWSHGCRSWAFRRG